MAAAGRPQPGRRKPRPQSARPTGGAQNARPASRATATATPDRQVPATAPGTRPDGRGGVLDWISVVLICAIAVLCALLELMLIPVYIGSVIVPVSVVGAVVSNIVLPWWGHRTLGRGVGAALPVIFWLVVLLGLSVVERPEGDLFVTAAYHQSWVYYGTILLGAVAGFTTLLRTTSPR